jgi:hypothetical protein
MIPSIVVRHRRMALALAVSAWVCSQGASGAQTLTLETVLSRAADYVDGYQHELSNVLAQESYVQEADGNRRHLRSELLVFSVPGSREPWVAFRDVIEVDGLDVEDREQRLADLFRESPVVTRALRRRLVDESARYNIGRVHRNFNVPTLALLLLTPGDQPRLSFEHVGDETIEGMSAWTIAFKEVEAPALIQNTAGADLFAEGRVWIEPDTGRVLRTELRARDDSVRLGLEFGVRYRYSAELDMLVPASMREHYLVLLPPHTTNRFSRGTIEVECLATYSNFRRFGVAVEMSVGAGRE